MWVFYLEWDITSAARANYVPVPGQGDFKGSVGGFRGEPLTNTLAMSVMPAGLRYANTPDNGLLPRASVASAQLWRGISGAWYYPKTSGSQVIYGLRLVLKGVLHPHKTSAVNYLIHDTTYSNGSSLAYNGGNLAVLKHRVK